MPDRLAFPKVGVQRFTRFRNHACILRVVSGNPQVNTGGPHVSRFNIEFLPIAHTTGQSVGEIRFLKGHFRGFGIPYVASWLHHELERSSIQLVVCHWEHGTPKGLCRLSMSCLPCPMYHVGGEWVFTSGQWVLTL